MDRLVGDHANLDIKLLTHMMCKRHVLGQKQLYHLWESINETTLRMVWENGFEMNWIICLEHLSKKQEKVVFNQNKAKVPEAIGTCPVQPYIPINRSLIGQGDVNKMVQ